MVPTTNMSASAPGVTTRSNARGGFNPPKSATDIFQEQFKALKMRFEDLQKDLSQVMAQMSQAKEMRKEFLTQITRLKADLGEMRTQQQQDCNKLKKQQSQITQLKGRCKEQRTLHLKSKSGTVGPPTKTTATKTTVKTRPNSPARPSSTAQPTTSASTSTPTKTNNRRSHTWCTISYN